ncbi:hypothetical protein C2845_PM14G15990 [Panicum miliaceum]|uniref:Uncharacterized protein n=1 Tax=Panicum miliaceum TaxID=4540 RepID=A0A3L6PS48_PANMI|nr:hypothetical protein C2845_PM14G15990 [Panicum miliaceum]
MWIGAGTFHVRAWQLLRPARRPWSWSGCRKGLVPARPIDPCEILLATWQVAQPESGSSRPHPWNPCPGVKNIYSAYSPVRARTGFWTGSMAVLPCLGLEAVGTWWFRASVHGVDIGDEGVACSLAISWLVPLSAGRLWATQRRVHRSRRTVSFVTQLAASCRARCVSS